MIFPQAANNFISSEKNTSASYINHYEALRNHVLFNKQETITNDSEYIVFSERGMLSWIKSRTVLSTTPILHKKEIHSKPKGTDIPASINPDAHSDVVSILSNIAFYYHLEGINYV